MEAFDTEEGHAALTAFVGIDDMIKMDNLTEEAILRNLKERYHGQRIYVSPFILKTSLYMPRIPRTHLMSHASISCFAPVLFQTNTGTILVSVNPYQKLPIYTQAVVREYIG